jgi:hypothetical protein
VSDTIKVFWVNGTLEAPVNADTGMARIDTVCTPEPAEVVLIAAPPEVSDRLNVVAVRYLT